MYPLITNKIKILIPSNQEIKLSKNEVAIFRTDIDGNFLYYNNTFSKISGYNNSELLYRPYSLIRHIDMPKSIYFIIWKTLLAGHTTSAILKNFTKDGDFYWLFTKFTVQKDNQNSIISFLIQGTQASNQLIKRIEPLYKELLKYEKEDSINSAIIELHSFLNRENIATYNDYIHNIIKEKRDGFFSNLIF